MYESDTYRAILEEGALQYARDVVLRFGQKKFGPASQDIVAAVNSIEDLERLVRLEEGIFHVSSWQELLRIP